MPFLPCRIWPNVVKHLHAFDVKCHQIPSAIADGIFYLFCSFFRENSVKNDCFSPPFRLRIVSAALPAPPSMFSPFPFSVRRRPACLLFSFVWSNFWIGPTGFTKFLVYILRLSQDSCSVNPFLTSFLFIFLDNANCRV